jgi:hypothetical protein
MLNQSLKYKSVQILKSDKIKKENVIPKCSIHMDQKKLNIKVFF